MSRKFSTRVSLLLIYLVACTGCTPTQPFFFHEDGDLSHYLDKAVTVDSPDLHTESLKDATETMNPLSLSNPKPESIKDVTLEDCVSIALQNTKVVRSGGLPRLQFGIQANQIAPGGGEGFLANSPRSLATIYDPAIQETEIGGAGDGRVFEGNVGTEAALAVFDAQFQMFAGGSPNSPGAIANVTNEPQNISQNLQFFNQQRQVRNASVIAQINKFTATGATFRARHRTDYEIGNGQGGVGVSNQANQSFWTTTVEVEAQYPLMQGRGALINRMPIVLARMRTDDEVANVDTQLQNMVCNLEIRYWDLHMAYRRLQAAQVERDRSLGTWKIVYEKWKQGVETVQAESQSRGLYFAARAAVESALSALYDAENALRQVMGLAATDGRLLRPTDEPTLARIQFDWREILAESLARRPELRRQRWQVKRRENEMVLAKNQLLPQLNLFGRYNWLGRGDDLINADRNGLNFPAAGSTSYDELTEGDYQGMQVGFDFLPAAFGARRELAGVRNVQLKLAREKAILEDMELDVSAGLTTAIRNLDTQYQLAQTNFNRWAAAEKEVESAMALYRGGKITLDRVLDAFVTRGQSRTAYYEAVTEYNKAISLIHLRKGSILDYCGVTFEEGPWAKKAYWDAVERARERDASYYLDYGWTRPGVVSRGVDQRTSNDFQLPKQDADQAEGDAGPTPAVPQEAVPPGSMGPLTSGDGQPFQWGSLGINGPENEAAESAAEALVEDRAQNPGYDWGGMNLPPVVHQTPEDAQSAPGSVQPARFEE